MFVWIFTRNLSSLNQYVSVAQFFLPMDALRQPPKNKNLISLNCEKLPSNNIIRTCPAWPGKFWVLICGFYCIVNDLWILSLLDLQPAMIVIVSWWIYSWTNSLFCMTLSHAVWRISHSWYYTASACIFLAIICLQFT